MKKKISSVDIKFGYSCNNNCIHCVISGHRERLLSQGREIDRSKEEIMNHISEAKALGTENVVFTGGEVTIRKDFIDLLSFAKSQELGVSLQTNGRAFCSINFAERTLKKHPYMHFEIAIHSSKKEIHDKITRVEGSFEQTLLGIKNLLSLGAKSVNLKIVISRLNYSDLGNLVKLAGELGINRVDIAFPHGMGNALKYWSEIVPRYSEIKKDLLSAAQIGKSLGVEVTFEAVPFCLLPRYETCVSEIEYLRQYSKEATTYLRQVGDPELDWEKSRISIKAKTENCKKCKFFKICEGVWKEYILLYGGEELVPIEEKYLNFKELLN